MDNKEFERIDKETFGARLKKAREQAKGKITQKDACDATGIPNVQTLSAYERGVNFPTIDTLAALASLYEVSVDELLFGEQNRHLKVKTPVEYLRDFVNAVDYLKFSFSEDDNGDLKIIIAQQPKFFNPTIRKSAAYDINNFMQSWVSLKSVCVSGAIDHSDYLTLVQKRLDRLDLGVSISADLFDDDEFDDDEFDDDEFDKGIDSTWLP